jgi:hypothetical protein
MIFVEPVENTKVSVRARIYDTSPTTEWEVLLYGIPYGKVGKEVVVSWFTPNINNNGTFYTDSNGLEMQERKINYRPTWNF